MDDKFMFIPPPEELIKKSVIVNEVIKTGAPINFIKFDKLNGDEPIEYVNKMKMKDKKNDNSDVDRTPSRNLNEHLINSFNDNKLVYCRFGQDFVKNLEKYSHSLVTTNPGGITAPNYSSATFLINIKKLVKEHNYDGE
jgi:hypothetical protein